VFGFLDITDGVVFPPMPVPSGASPTVVNLAESAEVSLAQPLGPRTYVVRIPSTSGGRAPRLLSMNLFYPCDELLPPGHIVTIAPCWTTKKFHNSGEQDDYGGCNHNQDG
jgi:hypothetical protein